MAAGIGVTRIRHSANQSISTATATVPPAMDTEDWALVGSHSVSTNPSRVTITEAGWYICTATWQCSGDPDGTRWVAILKNGGWAGQNTTGADTGGTTAVGITVPLYLEVDDYVEMYCYQNGGSTEDIVGGAADTPVLTVTGRGTAFAAAQTSGTLLMSSARRGRMW